MRLLLLLSLEQLRCEGRVENTDAVCRQAGQSITFRTSWAGDGKNHHSYYATRYVQSTNYPFLPKCGSITSIQGCVSCKGIHGIYLYCLLCLRLSIVESKLCGHIILVLVDDVAPAGCAEATHKIGVVSKMVISADQGGDVWSCRNHVVASGLSYPAFF